MPERVKLGRVAGLDVKINGNNTTTVTATNGVNLTQSGTTATFSADLNVIQSKITGEPTQIVGFDTAGNAVAIDANYELYGFELNMDESYGPNMIRYIAQNAGFTKAGLTGSVFSLFSYGDWANAWFIKNLRPCMMNYDGTVAYDLDKNDFGKKVDGTASDVANDAFPGNVMIGLPTVWVKVDTSSPRKPKFYFSNIQLDGSYTAYAHHDDFGNIMPYTYLPAYNGWVDGSGRLRSISGKYPTANQTGQVQITEARANNPSGVTCWDIEKFCDRQLINLLLILIGKTTDTQTAFGRGNENGYNDPAAGAGANGILNTGTMDNKGLFVGYFNDSNLAVKVFGMENYWGNLWRRTLGLVLSNGNYFYKLSKDTSDGSSISEFNISDLTTASVESHWVSGGPSIGNDGFIGDMKVGIYGLLPSATGGSSNSKYYDDYWENPQVQTVVYYGGSPYNEKGAGAFCCALNGWLDWSDWSLGAALSCKPNV